MEAVAALRYALDTFYGLVSGVLAMWVAAGFPMLESVLARSNSGFTANR
jgi:Amt family ammonium transporter